jgi:hypothetical protein
MAQVRLPRQRAGQEVGLAVVVRWLNRWVVLAAGTLRVHDGAVGIA